MWPCLNSTKIRLCNNVRSTIEGEKRMGKVPFYLKLCTPRVRLPSALVSLERRFADRREKGGLGPVADTWRAPLNSSQSSHHPRKVKPQMTIPTQPVKTNTMAILSLIFAFFFPLLGAIFGHVAMSQIKTTGEEGSGLALAGIIVGWVFTGLGTLFFLAFWSAFAASF